MASHTEIFLLKKVAPELLSKTGKVSVLFIYFVWTAIATYGFINCPVEFNFDFFLTDDTMPIAKYNTAKKKYFDGIGSTLNIYVNNTDVNFLSTESQL